MTSPTMSPTPLEPTNWLEDLSTWSEVARNVAEIAALIVGAMWAYDRFIRQREKWPRATIEHEIKHYPLPDRRRLLRVVERIRNPGAVLLEVSNRTTRIQQVLPIEKEPLSLLEKGEGREGEWFLLGEHVVDDSSTPNRIEPGESDQFEHDFLIPSHVTVIQVYSYFRNMKYRDRELGWGMTTLYDFATADEVKSASPALRARRKKVAHKKESQQPPKARPRPGQQEPKPPPPKPKDSQGGGSNQGKK